MTRLARARHSFGGANYHLQFTPKYRRWVFTSHRVQEFCRKAMTEKAEKLGIKLSAIEFGPDHVHVFVEGCKNHSASYLAGQLKGFSSYVIRRTCWPEISSQLWGKQFWSDGYFFETVGRVTGDMVKFYIERQQRKHWNGDDYEYFKLEKKKSKGQTILSVFESKILLRGQTRITDFAS